VRLGLGQALSLLCSAALFGGGVAHAQDSGTLAKPAPLAQTFSLQTMDSGLLEADAVQSSTLYTAEASVPGARWVRLEFEEASLGHPDGDPASGAWLIITSLEDGAVQYLNAESLAQWQNTTAYFNGPIVRVQIWSPPGVGASRVRVRGIYADAAEGGIAAQGADNGGEITPFDLCGGDDRVASTDPRMGRLAPAGCTAWMFNDANKMFLTAGHCSINGGSVVQFNVPLSTSNGTWVNPPPEDQYTVDASSLQFQNGGVGQDFAYFGVFPNSNTGLLPAQRQGQWFNLAPSVPAPAGQTVRVSGYGTVAPPVSLTFSSTQRTDTGPLTILNNNILAYRVDTTGGNSGSPVIDETGALGPAGSVLAIHTHLGCAANGNQGTIVTQATLQSRLAAPTGICRTGAGTPAGSLYLIGDLANNFGTVSVSPNNFARVSTIGSRWQGLTYDYTAGVFYAIDSERRVFSVTTAGVATQLGTIANVAVTLAGLAFDPFAQRLFAIDPVVGQVYLIDRSAWTAAPTGQPLGGTHRALEFDVLRRTLWSIDQTGGQATLVSIHPDTIARSVVGIVGAGVASTGDLAANPTDGQLYLVNPSNGDLVRINPLTGQGIDLGPTNGLFSSSHGLAFAISPTPGFAPVFHGATIIDDKAGTGNRNNRPEPGEDRVRVWLQVINGGIEPGSALLGTITSLSPTVEVIRGELSWPALTPGSAPYSDFPIVLSIDPSHPCGSPINLRLEASAPEGGITTDFTLSTGTAAPLGDPVTVSYTTPAVPIPADTPSGVTTAVNFAGLTSIADVDFRFNGTNCTTTSGNTAVGLNHTWVGDLVIRLISPAGTTVDLMVRPGGTNNNGRNICQTLLDDSATNAIQTVVNTQAPYVGSWRPASPLATFRGQDPRGQWRLVTVDNVTSDTGWVRNWSLIVRPPGPTTCAAPGSLAVNMDYNADTFLNLDDLSDFITDFYTYPPMLGPGGYAVPCPGNPAPFDQGYRTGYSTDGAGWCVAPNLDALSDFITDFYVAYSAQ
jgi:V8-like Glu-specific endopeptidase/subtilisin-like proprotein convertase family protein